MAKNQAQQLSPFIRPTSDRIAIKSAMPSKHADYHGIALYNKSYQISIRVIPGPPLDRWLTADITNSASGPANSQQGVTFYCSFCELCLLCSVAEMRALHHDIDEAAG